MPAEGDDENSNDNRAAWAEVAIAAFIAETGTDREDALADLLGDLRHWADRNGVDYAAEDARGYNYYTEEL